jgi:PTH2 family peptidyl-tRNA hydrolase
VANVKQVIVMRKDLNMRKGKMVAQGSHGSMKFLIDRLKMWGITSGDTESHNRRCIVFTSEEMEWVNGLFTKICVSVNSEAELLEVYNKAKEAGLNCSLITDSGLTEFAGVPTNTCCAIGPNESEKIDAITGGLQLL